MKLIHRYLYTIILNNLLTLVIFMLLTWKFNFSISYSISYLFGIIFNTFVIPRFVFRVAKSKRAKFTFSLIFIYSCQFLIGIYINSMMESRGFSAFMASIFNLSFAFLFFYLIISLKILFNRN